MNDLALFAGAGGSILAGKLLGWKTVCAVEIDSYCREVLLRRQRDGLLPLFPIWDDVQTFNGKAWRGTVDIISAGFPCQPWATASRKNKGQYDKRNLWPDTIRIIREVGPRFVFLENVPRLLAFDYFGQILGDLSESGYDARWEVISAASLGAPHVRSRLWILAYPNGQNAFMPTDNIRSRLRRILSRGWNATGNRFDKDHLSLLSPQAAARTPKHKLRLVVNGMARWVDQIRAIGNGQVPQVAALAFLLLSEGLVIPGDDNDQIPIIPKRKESIHART